MSRIRGTNTKPELILRRAIRQAGYRYRVAPKLFGRPDLAFTVERVAVFVDGCFWHACPEHRVEPKNNAGFWRLKIGRTMERDRLVSRTLTTDGWLVLRYWEHEVEAHTARVIREVTRSLWKRRQARIRDQSRKVNIE